MEIHMNKFVQDPGIENIQKNFVNKEYLELLLHSNDNSLAQEIHVAVQLHRENLPSRVRSDIACLNDYIVATLYQDEFENIIVPLLKNKRLRHAHLNRQAVL
jgi:hypothetical protein